MPKSGWDHVIDNSSQEVVQMPQPPHFEEVALGKLIIDPGYQRELIEPHLKKIREDFEEAQLGVLEVSRRNANEYAVFDGQHRLVVLRERLPGGAARPVHLPPVPTADRRAGAGGAGAYPQRWRGALQTRDRRRGA
jgi:hypothetical protein